MYGSSKGLGVEKGHPVVSIHGSRLYRETEIDPLPGLQDHMSNLKPPVDAYYFAHVLDEPVIE